MVVYFGKDQSREFCTDPFTSQSPVLVYVVEEHCYLIEHCLLRNHVKQQFILTMCFSFKFEVS